MYLHLQRFLMKTSPLWLGLNVNLSVCRVLISQISHGSHRKRYCNASSQESWKYACSSTWHNQCLDHECCWREDERNVKVIGGNTEEHLQITFQLSTLSSFPDILHLFHLSDFVIKITKLYRCSTLHKLKCIVLTIWWKSETKLIPIKRDNWNGWSFFTLQVWKMWESINLRDQIIERC